jgi:hypothetical protein
LKALTDALKSVVKVLSPVPIVTRVPEDKTYPIPVAPVTPVAP